MSEVKNEDMPLGVVDATDEDALTVEGFDLAAWIAGARPTRRSVTVYARGDLMADLDEVEDEIRALKSAGKDYEDAEKRSRAIADEMISSGLRVVVEARSQEAVGAARAGIDEEGDVLAYNLAGIACHIVEPAGFDADMLHRLWEVQPLQVDRIMKACMDADSSTPSVSVPFSGVSSRSGAGRA